MWRQSCLVFPNHCSSTLDIFKSSNLPILYPGSNILFSPLDPLPQTPPGLLRMLRTPCTVRLWVQVPGAVSIVVAAVVDFCVLFYTGPRHMYCGPATRAELTDLARTRR